MCTHSSQSNETLPYKTLLYYPIPSQLPPQGAMIYPNKISTLSSFQLEWSRPVLEISDLLQSDTYAKYNKSIGAVSIAIAKHGLWVPALVVKWPDPPWTTTTSRALSSLLSLSLSYLPIFSLCGVTCLCLYTMQTDAEYMAGMTIHPHHQMQCCKMNVYSLKGQAPLSHNIFTKSRLGARYSSRCWDIGLGQQFLQNLWSEGAIRKEIHTNQLAIAAPGYHIRH